MARDDKNNPAPVATEEKSIRKSPLRRVMKWIGIVLAIIIGVPMLLLVALSIWLTPSRLTNLVNTEGSKYLKADIHADKVDYSLWRTFPRFRITTGNITLTSRSLDGASPEIKRQLPDSAEFLGSLRSFTGEINVVDLFMNRYVLHDVSVDGLKLNLVAYNDSINNYNIVPPGGSGFKKVPYIRANKIELKNPGVMSYRSVSTDTQASLRLQSLLLNRETGGNSKENTYRLALGGAVTATSAGLNILTDFPFSLGGELQLRFDPFGVALKDYAIDLGEIKSTLSMSLGVGDDPRIESFDYKIKSVSLTGLLGYLPKEFVPSLQGIQADMHVSASARLLSAWSLSSEDLPSIAVDFNVPEGDVDYMLALSPKGGPTRMKTYAMHHSPIDAEFVFNGKTPVDSYIDVKPFDVTSAGVKLNLGVMITSLTEHPLVSADIGVDADVAQSLPLLPLTPPVNASGNVNVASKVVFSVADFSKEGLEQGLKNFSVTADLKAKDLAINAPELGLKGNVSNFNLRISESSDIFNTTGILNPEVSVKGDLSSAALSMSGGSRLNAGKLGFATGLTYSGLLTPQILAAGLPMSLKGYVDNVRYSDPASSMTIAANSITFTDKVSKHTGDPAYDLLSDGLNISSPRVDLISGDNRLTLSGIDFNGRVSIPEPGSASGPTPPATPSVKAPADSYRGLPHTPELLSFDIPDGLRNFISRYSFSANLKTRRVDIRTRGLRHGNYLSNIDLVINDNEAGIRNIDMMLKQTRANAQAYIRNLKNFLLLPASESNPLAIDMNLALDVVNINALARAYVESKGGMDNIPRHTKVTADDSIALLVPRNVDAHVRFSAKETIYTNLHLFNLGADVKASRGILDIPNLGVGASFGKAAMNVNYNSADIDNMSLNLGLDIMDVDIVKFFKKFHTLLEMMPEMKNLSGMLSANVKLGTRIFPDMYINMPATSAELDVKGRGLTVHQSKFIRKITKMMLIHTDDDIHIHNMDVHAGIHDNLLQLDPFYFEFDRYRLQMLGINNFNGDLYYHIAVDKSPVPFPFSVNIEGEFHHPKLRFGGPTYDDKRAEQVTSRIQEENNINMVLILRQFLRAFIGKAAESGN